jgi:hypothetical protein
MELPKNYWQKAQIEAFRKERFDRAATRVTTRERGDIPGCKKPGTDSHMATDSRGRPWLHAPPSTVDAWLAELRANVKATRKQRNACEVCGEMECDHGNKRRKVKPGLDRLGAGEIAEGQNIP